MGKMKEVFMNLRAIGMEDEPLSPELIEWSRRYDQYSTDRMAFNIGQTTVSPHLPKIPRNNQSNNNPNNK